MNSYIDNKFPFPIKSKHFLKLPFAFFENIEKLCSNCKSESNLMYRICRHFENSLSNDYQNRANL